MIKDAFFVLKLLLRNTFGDRIKNNKKVSPIIATVVIGLLITAYIAFLAFSFSFGTAFFDDQGWVAGTFIALTQLVVLVLGIFAVINILYFSKDTMLLSSLPIKSSSIFMAKLMLIYICELGISLVISIPSLLTIGIYRIVMHLEVSAGYFIYTILSVFLLPAIPLLIVSMISMPLMYLVSYLKKHSIANVVFSLLLGSAIISVVLAMQIYVNSGQAFKGADDDTAMLAMLLLHQIINKIFIFNYPLRMALTNGTAMSMLWFIAYVAVVIFAIAISIFISSILYGKIIGRGLESGASKENKKAKGQLDFSSLSFRKTFFKKEVRTFIATPALFINFIMPMIMLPIMGVIMASSMGSIPEEEAALFTPAYIAFPMILFMAVMITSFSNYPALIGFSREGKNFTTLKTLPVSANEIVRLKSLLAYMITAILSVVSGISAATCLALCKCSFWSIIIGALGTTIVTLLFGLGYDMVALTNDMKKLNIHWQNLTEITKKNPNIIGVQLLVIGVAMIMMIASIAVFIGLSILGLNDVELVAISLSICILIALLVFVIARHRLNKNPQKWFDEVE